jgi:hypothetical protein
MGGMFGGGGGSSTQQQVYAGMQVSTSLYSGCIPYVAGRQRVPANLLWYGNFQVHTSNSGGGKGGGGGGTKQYSYSTAYIAGLCIGPIQGVTQVWHDKALVTLTFEGLALAEGSASFVATISGTSMVVTKMNGGVIAVGGAALTGPGVTAGSTITSGPGGTGTYVITPSQTVASATTMHAAQPTWSGYPSGTPTVQKIPYDSLAYVASSSYNLGSSAGMPNLTFEVEGCVPGYSDANSIFDADPSAVFLDYLLDSVHGALANYPGAPLTLGSSTFPLQGTSNSYQSYVMSVGLLTSPYEDTQRPSTDFVTELLQATNSTCRLSVGTLEILPYADAAVSKTVAGTAFSYTPNLTPVYSFTDDDYISAKNEAPLKLTRVPQSDTVNTISIEYNDRTNYYNQAPVTCSDLNDIALYGPRIGSQLSLHQITQSSVALMAGQLWLTRQLYERNTWTAQVRADYALLEPGDYIAHNDAALGLSGQVCQITQIEDDAENVLTLTALELPGVTRSLAQFNWSAAAGYFANYQADPGAIQTPAIFMMPPIPGALTNGITLGMAACGATANGAWLGCDVYCSVDGGTTYQFVGIIPEAARYGTLTANISAVADPDTTSTLSIALANTNLQISTSVTHAEADSCQTMILVDTGTQAEVMSFGAAALASAGHYNLTYLRRGLYGSTDQSHVTTDLFVRLDGAIFQMAMDPGYAGVTVNFKFVSFNTYKQYGNQTLASSTAYPYTIPSALPVSGSNQLIPRGTCAVSADGTTVYKQPNGTAAWDSDAYSPQAYLNGCFISFRVGQITGQSAVGLSTNPTASTSYTSLNFDINPSAGTVFINEGAILVLTAGSYGLNDTFEIRYDAVTVRYFQNGALLRAVRASGLTLYPKVCIFTPGNVVSNVEFGPASAVNQPTGSLLNTYSWVIGSAGNQGNYQDISQLTAGQIVLGNGTLTSPYGPYGTSEPLWQGAGGSVGASIDAGWANKGDLYGIDSAKTYRSIVWFRFHASTSGSIFFGADNTGNTCNIGTQVASANPYFVNGIALSGLSIDKWYMLVGFLHGAGYTGASSSLGGVYDPVSGTLVSAGGDLNILSGAPFQMQRAFVYNSTVPGQSLWFDKPRFEEVNGNEPSLQALMQPAIVNNFVATGQCQVNGQTATKQGGATAWDSCVYSINGFPTCHIQAKPNGLGDFAMAGLSTAPSLSSSYTNMNYGWFNNAGTWTIYESGVNFAGANTAASLSDVVAVTYDASTITYWLNGISKRTVAVSSLILYGFCPFESPGSGLNSLSFGPTTSLAVQDTSQIGNNAVSQIVSATRASTSSYSFQSAIVDVDDLTVSITTTGNPIGVDVTFELEVAVNGGTFASPMTATVTRSGTAIGTAVVNIYDYVTNTTPIGSPASLWTVQQTLTVVDAPSAGTYTYALHLHAAQAGGGTVHNFGTVNPVLKVREYKK